jgi:Zn-dependent M28 family amino/carboxypeptidase
MLGAAACGAARFPVDGARAHARVVRQVEAGPRIPGSPGHARIQHWLIGELERLGAAVERQEVADSTLGHTIRLTNVIAHYRGRSAARGPILLCAHYDTRPWCDEDPDPKHRGDPLPGANDGASGVAVLLEVAELLSHRPAPVPVDLVFFDGEDQGRASQPEEFSLGARAYARRLAVPRPVAGFLFDMVGDKDLAVYAEAHSAERAANIAEVVFEAARATGARGFHPETRHRVVDDHLPLLDAGVPAVDVIDFDFPAWHTRRDLPDQVSAESLAEVARVAAWLVYASPLTHLR